MKIIFIADFFADEILGGGEINNEELAKSLREKGHAVVEKKCSHATSEYITENLDCCFVISNFVQLLEEVKETLMQSRYIIYEHDHKYLRNRNPAAFPDYQAPDSEVINRDFYRNALGVFCQSNFHTEIVRKNLVLDNIKNLSGNIWSDDTLEYLEQLAAHPKEDRFSVLNSPIDHKNTVGAVRYCASSGYPYRLVASSDYHDFLRQLSENNKFVFLPNTPETLSRIAVEARMLGIEVHANSRVGATYEEWFSSKGKELIDQMRVRRTEIVGAVEEIFLTDRCTANIAKIDYPKISIITSLYNGDEYIDGFLQNMVRQSIFEQCELIIIDGNSPGNEYSIIKQYMEAFPNIIYKRLEEDPGIYGCWTEALSMASGEFITNANLDDCRSLQQLEIFANELLSNSDIDLVYSQCYMTSAPNETYSLNTSDGVIYPVTDYSPENMIKCLPGCMPVWRKSLHDNAGVFNAQYKFAGDWDMWLRAVRAGSKFKRIEGIHGLYYNNPAGLTTSVSRQEKKFAEEQLVFHEYPDIFGEFVTNQYKQYFDKVEK